MEEDAAPDEVDVVVPERIFQLQPLSVAPGIIKGVTKKNRLTASTIKKVVTGNGIMVAATGDNHILRWKYDSMQIGSVDDVVIPSKDSIRDIFLDPTGSHLIVAYNNGENYYIGTYVKEKPKLLKRLPVPVDSVGWRKVDSTAQSTKPFLVGTSKGSVYEVDVTNNHHEAEIVFEIEGRKPIQSIEIEQFITPGN